MSLWHFTFDGAIVTVEDQVGFDMGELRLGMITATFSDRLPESVDADFVLTCEGGLRYFLTDDGSVVVSCETSSELSTCLQRLITDSIIRNAKTLTFIHAASVIRASDGLTVALPGLSGSGKSTLARILGEHGYEICSDDVVALATDGSMRPFENRYGIDGRLNLLLVTAYGDDLIWVVRKLSPDQAIADLHRASLGFDPETADEGAAARHFDCLAKCSLSATAWAGVRPDAERCVAAVDRLLDGCRS